MKDDLNISGAGLETPDMIELRKRRIEADMEGGDTPSLPYTIIPERKNERIGKYVEYKARSIFFKMFFQP